MTRTARQRIALLLGVAALLALAGWQWRRDHADVADALLTAPPQSIQHIELRIGDAPAEHFEKRDGQWWCTDGPARRADDGRLGQLTAIAAASVLSWRAASDFDPAKIGLQPPRAVLKLDDATLEFGEVSVTGPQTYVRVSNGHASPRVALISLRYLPRAAGGNRLHAS